MITAGNCWRNTPSFPWTTWSLLKERIWKLCLPRALCCASALTAWHLSYDIRRTYDLIKDLKGYFAISTDFNPGTSFSPSPWQAITVGHIEFGLPIFELFFASTVYAAKALGLSDRGAILPGNKADLAVLSVPAWIG